MPEKRSAAAVETPSATKRGRGAKTAGGDPAKASSKKAKPSPSGNESKEEDTRKKAPCKDTPTQQPRVRTLDAWIVRDSPTRAPRISALRSLSPDAAVIKAGSRTTSPPKKSKSREEQVALIERSGSPSTGHAGNTASAGAAITATAVTPPGDKPRGKRSPVKVSSPAPGMEAAANILQPSLGQTQATAVAPAPSGCDKAVSPSATKKKQGKRYSAARGMDTFTRRGVRTPPSKPKKGTVAAAVVLPAAEEKATVTSIPTTDAAPVSPGRRSGPSHENAPARSQHNPVGATTTANNRASPTVRAEGVVSAAPRSPLTSRIAPFLPVSATTTGLKDAATTGTTKSASGSSYPSRRRGSPTASRTTVSPPKSSLPLKKNASAVASTAGATPTPVSHAATSGASKAGGDEQGVENGGSGRCAVICDAGVEKQEQENAGRACSSRPREHEATGCSAAMAMSGKGTTPFSKRDVVEMEAPVAASASASSVSARKTAAPAKKRQKKASAPAGDVHAAKKGGAREKKEAGVGKAGAGKAGVGKPGAKKVAASKKSNTRKSVKALEEKAEPSMKKGGGRDVPGKVPGEKNLGEPPSMAACGSGKQKVPAPAAASAATAAAATAVPAATPATATPATAATASATATASPSAIAASLLFSSKPPAASNAPPARTDAATFPLTATPTTGTRPSGSAVKQTKQERMAMIAAAGGQGWAKPGVAGASAATAAEMPEPEEEHEMHVMVGDVMQQKCRHCKTRFGRAGCSSGGCFDCCFKAGLACTAHAKQIDRKRMEDELLAAGPSQSQLAEERRRLAKGVFKEEAIHAIGDTATIWCITDFLRAKSNHGALKALSRTQRATAGRNTPRPSARVSRISGVRGRGAKKPAPVPSTPAEEARVTGTANASASGDGAGEVAVSGRKPSRVRPALARWRRKNMQMLDAVSGAAAAAAAVAVPSVSER